MQTKHGHIYLKQFLQFYSTFNMYCYILYTYLSIPLVFFFFVVEYTLKLVHRTPNIQTNLNTVKLHYSNIKMECSVSMLSACPQAAVNVTVR